MAGLGWLNTVLSVFALVSASALALQVTNYRNLRDNLVEMRAEVGDKDRRITEKDRLLGDAVKQIEELERTAQVLAHTVTGEAHLVAMDGKLDDYHKGTTKLLIEIRDEIRRGNGHA